MTWVDFIVLGLLLVSGLLAYMRRLVREILGLGAWLGAVAVTYWGFDFARPYVGRLFGGLGDWVAAWLTITILFIAALIVLLLMAHWVGKRARKSVLGGVDRTLGMLFGLARGAALVVVAYILGGLMPGVDQWPKAVVDARSTYFAYLGAGWVVKHVPTTSRFHPPPVYAPPLQHEPTAEELLRASPQGRAVNRQ